MSRASADLFAILEAESLFVAGHHDTTGIAELVVRVAHHVMVHVTRRPHEDAARDARRWNLTEEQIARSEILDDGRKPQQPPHAGNHTALHDLTAGGGEWH